VKEKRREKMEVEDERKREKKRFGDFL